MVYSETVTVNIPWMFVDSITVVVTVIVWFIQGIGRTLSWSQRHICRICLIIFEWSCHVPTVLFQAIGNLLIWNGTGSVAMMNAGVTIRVAGATLILLCARRKPKKDQRVAPSQPAGPMITSLRWTFSLTSAPNIQPLWYLGSWMASGAWLRMEWNRAQVRCTTGIYSMAQDIHGFRGVRCNFWPATSAIHC